MRADDISLIQGPPGTGKSTAIAELIWQHIRLNPKERILLTSETNLAVDNAIDRTVNNTHNLVKPIRFGADDRLAVEGKQFSIAAMEQWVATGKYEVVDEQEEDLEEDNLVKSGKMILVNWLDNIKKRIDHDRMDTKSVLLWENFLANPDKQLRELIFEEVRKEINNELPSRLKCLYVCSSLDEIEELYEDNIGLIRSVVKRYVNRGTDSEDLFQIGSIGLIKAIRNFDLSFDVCFSTYAVPMIAGEIRRYLRDEGPVKVSRTVKELGFKI